VVILALDTTTRAGSTALLRDDQVLAVATGDPARTHAERLPAALVRVLQGQQLGLLDVDVFAVAAGPGSFTGLRIGIATIQGLAFAVGRPVVGVSTLDALAEVAREADSGGAPLVAAWMDAQRNEVFAALYRTRQPGAVAVPLDAARGASSDSRKAQGTPPRHPSAAAAQGTPPTPLALIDGPVSEPPVRVLDRWQALTRGQPISVAGDGIARYRQDLVERLGAGFRPVEPLPPLAPTIARIAGREAAAGRGVAPHAIRPVYVRRPDAELARDRKR